MILNFPAIEAMQEASEAAGWQCEYRQLDAGRLEARTILRDFGDASFLRESASRRLSIVAESPPDAVTIIVPASDFSFRINGIDVTNNTVVVVPVSTDFHALSDPGADALSMHISAERFQDLADAATGKKDTRLFSDVCGIETNPDTLRHLRFLISAHTLESPGRPVSLEDRAFLDRSIVEVLRAALASGHRGLSSRQAKAHRVTRKSLEFIDTNLNSDMTIIDLCRVAGVSLRTLERVFRRELQMTPLAYIRARRLDAIRRALIKGDAETPIARLAHDHGISHLGRFAAHYRRQFGVLPSEQRQF